jgi:hypothetical protein
VDDTKVVVWGLPSRLAADPLMNPDPVKVTVVFGDPTVAEVGEMLLSKGTGLDDDAPPLAGWFPQPASESRAQIVRRALAINRCLRFVFKSILGLFLGLVECYRALYLHRGHSYRGAGLRPIM